MASWFAVHKRGGILCSGGSKKAVLSELAVLYDLSTTAASRVCPGLYSTSLDTCGDGCLVGREPELRQRGLGWAFDHEPSPTVQADEGFARMSPSAIREGDVLRLAGQMAEPVVHAGSWLQDDAGRRFRLVTVLDGAVRRTLYLIETVSYLVRRRARSPHTED